jgi:hypothetical protein
MSDKDSVRTAPAASPSDDDEGFLSRWSRLKNAERSGVAEGPEQDTAAPAALPGDDGATEETESAPLTDADMPPLESLSGNSDVSGFLSKGVSEGLRRAALRKLFHSPKFNVCDGLDDYCEDFTNFPALGSTITADMRHHMERLLKERMAQAGEAVEAVEASDAQDSVARSGAAAAETDGGENMDESLDVPADGDESRAKVNNDRKDV